MHPIDSFGRPGAVLALIVLVGWGIWHVAYETTMYYRHHRRGHR